MPTPLLRLTTIIVPSQDQLSGTTDYGDLSSIMPVLQFNTPGNAGQGHTNQYRVADPYEYYVTPAKCFALLAYRLLKDNAALARQIIHDNPPVMSKQEYLRLLESMSKTETMAIKPVPDAATL